MTAQPSRRWHNFDAIRLAAATGVVLSHSFLLSATGYEHEPLTKILGYHNDLGLVCVGVFFIISGFLITRSFVNRSSPTSYLFSRVMRIFPGLIVCTLFTAFVIGPFFAHSIGAYVTDGHLWSYVERTVLLQTNGGSGFPVSLYDGPEGTMMLGTTWSLPAEFECYVIVLLFGVVGMLRLPGALVLLVASVWAHGHWSLPMFESLAWTLMFFAAGTVLYFLHERRRPTRAMVAGATVGLIVACAAGYAMEGIAAFGSVLVIQLATSDRISLPNAARYGDLSYGVYLYGWPIQQVMLVLWGPSIVWWQMFGLAMPVALGCAWLSWRLIEARSLAAAGKFRRAELAKVTAEPLPIAG